VDLSQVQSERRALHAPKVIWCPDPREVSDPNFQGDPDYSKWCGRGTIVLVRPQEARVQVVPMRCGSWTCPVCSDRKRKALMARLHKANITAFWTLTCAHPDGTSPKQAEDAIRKGWSKFVQEIRDYDAGFQYFRVLEYQKNGWPHVHLGVRTCWFPKHRIEAAWRKHCWPGFIKLRVVNDKSGIPWELTKYLTKCAAIAAQLKKGQRLFSSSRSFFPDDDASTPDQDTTEILWFLTDTHGAKVVTLLCSMFPFRIARESTDEGIILETYASWFRSELPKLLAFLEDLPWFSPRSSGRKRSPPLAAGSD